MRLKRSNTPSQTGFPSLRTPKSDRLLDVASVIARLDKGLRSCLTNSLEKKPRGLVSITLAAPELADRWRPTLVRDSVYWANSGGQCYRFGIGRSVAFEAAGGRRFVHLEDEFAGLRRNWRRLDPEATGIAPLAFLGFSFLPQETARLPWHDHADASLFVPSLLLERKGPACNLTFSGVLGGTSGVEELRHNWLRLTTELLSGFPPVAEDPLWRSRQPLARIEHLPSDGEWLARAEEALEAIRAGLLEKIVLTRRMRVAGKYTLRATRLVRWLESHYPGCVQFAINMGGGTLVGASPERLAVLSNHHLITDALAGTTVRMSRETTGHSSGEALLRNPKDRNEHRLVVDDIVRSLAPLCENLNAPAVPQVMTLPTLQHLWSPIHGRIKSGVSLLKLVAHLHPTPAVGGVPRGEAIKWLTGHGESHRGWYTGAMGWLDADGGGELSVTLRCAMLRGNTADLFSGAGLVADSDPRSELAETEWKFQTMLDALAAS